MSKSIAEKWAARITNAVSKYEYTESETVYFIQQAIDEATREAVVEALAQQKRYNRKKLYDKLFKMKQEADDE